MHKNLGQFITIEEACDLLKVSLPTFNKLRREHSLSEVRGQQRRNLFNKFEIMDKIISKKPCAILPVDLVFSSSDEEVLKLLVDSTIFDLRAINLIDSYGVVSLLSKIDEIVNHKGMVGLIIDDSTSSIYLNDAGFFNELERSYNKFIKWNKKIQNHLPQNDSEVLYPLKAIRHKGQDKSAIEDLAPILLRQGFSSEMVGVMGWILGEISDNSLTHSKEVPCYFMVSKYPGETKYLQVGFFDAGIGIADSLRKNKNYSSLNDKQAFLTAFKPFISSWSEEAKRGKGLTDVVNISMGNRSFFKVDSDDLSLYWDFVDLKREVNFVNPLIKSPGVRFCFVLIDEYFDIKEENREIIKELINKKLEQENE